MCRELLREDWEFLSDDGEGQILEDNDNGWTEDLNAEVVETLRKSRCLQVGFYWIPRFVSRVVNSAVDL